MKNFSPIYKICAALTFCFILASCATQKEKQARINLVDSLIKTNHFKFVAQRANPLRAGLIDVRLQQLDGSNYLKVSQDTLSAQLPYFGVAQSAPYGSNDNGIQFTTTDFDYDKKKTAKGTEITITPKNTDKARKMYLNISKNGSAQLNVNSNNRDAISFDGTIEKP